MTISKMPARALYALAVAVGCFIPTAFGPARADDTRDVNRGNEDLTNTQAAPGAPTTDGQQAIPGTQTAGGKKAVTGKPTLPVKDTASGKPAPTGKPVSPRSGLRVGRSKIITGIASVYGRDLHGQRTATGERFNMYAMTLACRRLPLGTRVRVTNLRNGKSVIGRVNDIGPNGRFRRTRVADLSSGMARSIGMAYGLGRVRLEAVGR